MRRLIYIIYLFLLMIQLNAQEFLFDSHLVIRNVAEKAQDTREIATLNYDVYDLEGAKLFTVKKRSAYDIPFPRPLISNDGRLILVNAFEAELDYYNNSGIYLKTVSLLKNPEPNYERAIFSDISDNISVHLITESVERNLLLIILDSEGNEINNFKLESGQGTGIGLDDPSELIAVSQYSWNGDKLNTISSIYNISGDVIASFTGQFKHAKFLNQGRKICGFTNKHLFLGSVENGDILLNVEAPANNLILDSYGNNDYLWIAFSPNPRLKSGDWIYKNINYSQYDLEGELIRTGEFKTSQFSKARFKSVPGGIKLLLDSTEYALD